MSDPVRYRIEPKNPAAHLFQVSCTVADPDPHGQCFTLPAWIPGSYLIRDFARHIVRLSANNESGPVAVSKLDKQTWTCAPCQGPLTVTYEVYAWDLSVRAAHLDTTHGYFNGTSVFLAVRGKENDPCSVEILPPAGDAYRGWRLATSMARRDAEPWGFGTYGACAYEDLVDHPVEMGWFVVASFEALGVPHDVVITGRHRVDLERLCADLKTLCEHHIRFFGTPPPMDRYTFLIWAVGSGYGGLEHRASASLLCSRDELPRSSKEGGDDGVCEGYRNFLGLVSHEYFHLWNIKRIRPEAFVPYDLSREVHTRLLWAFEGFTSYYDDLALVRSGLITPESYLELLERTATRVLRGSGRLKQTLEESSFDAWTKFYRQDENSPNAIVSYYAKGALVALALDLILRREGAVSLDDVMRALWERYGRAAVGVPEDGIERVVREVSSLDLSDFFDRALRSTSDLPLKELLAHVGVDVRLRPAESGHDKGGRAASKDETQLAQRGTLGVSLTGSDDEAKLSHVLDGGAAQEAGLAAGDIVIAVEGLRVMRDSLEKRIASCPPGITVRVVAFRRDELMEFDVTLKAPPADTCVLTLMQDVDEATRERRSAWLQGLRSLRSPWPGGTADPS